MAPLEQAILDVIQDGFPIAERPYAELARILNDCGAGSTGVTESEAFSLVEGLRATGVIRRIGGVYDSLKLGFVSRLVAGKVYALGNKATDDSALNEFAAAVNRVPAVTHNYVRSHAYNVWFTVIAESAAAIDSIVDKLIATTALRDVHVLPATRKIKINTVMGKAATRMVSATGTATNVATGVTADSLTAAELSDADKCRVRALSGDLPHTLTPFVDVFAGVSQTGANAAGDLPSFLAAIRGDLASGLMRRFGAVLRHQEAGFAHNAMVCFEHPLAPDADRILTTEPHISHCYERPPFEGFPYNLYAMFHAASAGELEQAIAQTASALSAGSACQVKYTVLHSLLELKKTSFTFF